MHAHITTYKGRLIFQLLTRKSIKHEVITNLDNPQSIGHVIINTKKNLGISKEALTLLKTLHKGTKHVGHLDWSKSHQGLDSFVWIGKANDIRSPEELEASKTYKIMSHIVIENCVPQEAMQAIDQVTKKFKMK